MDGMKPSRFTPKHSIRTILFKRAAALLLLFVLALSSAGCSGQNYREYSLMKQEYDFDETPCKKADNEPFRIGFLDLGPPIESSYLCLKGLAEGLQSMGYIPAGTDLSTETEDFFEYYEHLLSSDLGEYIEFDDEPYMIDTEGNEEIANTLKDKAASGELDVIVATGTDPGLFLKSLSLPIPFLVCLASDPVGSGIIDSAEDSGDPNIWALVEPLPLKRQFEGYQRMLGFQKVALFCISDYELIAGTAEYRDAAKELSVDLAEYSFTEAESFEPDFTDRLWETVKSMDLTDVDVILYGFGTVSEENVGEISDYFAAKGIPTLVSDGDYLSREGSLMCLSCFDYEGYGNFAAKVLSNVFHGQKAGDQPCVVQSSPHIVLNMTTAKKTGFKTDIELLNSVDVFYR